MKIFLAWSGPQSHRVARALRQWLPGVLPGLQPIVSSDDIAKGTAWFSELGRELHESFFGILCVVPGNQESPWLAFEAGALSRFVDQQRVAPFLVGVTPSTLPGPLSLFQCTTYSREDLVQLVRSIGSAFSLDAGNLAASEERVEKNWEELDSLLAPVLAEIADSASRAAATILVGASGKEYRLGRLIHESGRSRIHEVHDGTGLRIAKFFQGFWEPESRAFRSFLQEVRAVEVLNHPNIAPLLDRGVHDGAPFLVTEHYEQTLRDVLDGRDWLPGREVLTLASPVAAALDHAHAAGVVHRDVKPENILVDSSRGIALSDFGVARLLGASQAAITAEGPSIVGTPVYIAPECLRGGPITAAADIYSYSVLVLEMLTGQSPFPGIQRLPDLVVAKLHTAPEIPAGRRLPQTVSDRILAGLSAEPGDRPQSASDLLGGLEQTIAEVR